MTEAFAAINGERVAAARLHVAAEGAWFVECDLETDPALEGRVEVELGSIKLSGTVHRGHNGTFGLQRRCRIIAGGGGWGETVDAKAYHNDAGVKARTVAEDAARAVGETIGGFVPALERLGVDYVRQEGPAVRVLEDAAGLGVGWWVDYAGVTHVGLRPTAALDASAYELLAFNPLTRIATLAIDDLDKLAIGSILTERLDAPATIREFEVTIDQHVGVRVTAWTGGDAGAPGRLASLIRALARRVTDEKLLGKYRYRVVRMASDGRVELQAVRRDARLPDILPVSQWPGVAGAHAELAAGAEVLVEFIEGDRTLPIVSNYAGKNGPGFVPQSLVFCASEQRSARQGDLVQSGGVGTCLMLLPVPPAVAGPALLPGVPYLAHFSAIAPTPEQPQAPLYGAISTGSPKVKT